MHINYKEINKVINLDWNKCINYDLDIDTKNFVTMFVNEYYSKVHLGLLDYTYNKELRKELLNELLKLVFDKKCELYSNIMDCINDIDNEKNILILINNIFKLQSCKNIEW